MKASIARLSMSEAPQQGILEMDLPGRSYASFKAIADYGKGVLA